MLGRFALSLLLFPLLLAAKPNFVILFIDDLGYADIGPFGSILHRTPHLDRMAAEGRTLTSFYVSANVCTPSRASLMTGCYPRRVGLDENEKGDWVLFPGNHEGLNSAEITLAEILKGAGYRTAIVGKWHLGDQPQFLPTRQGFDSYFGIPYSNDMGHDSRPEPYRYPPLPMLRNEQVVEQEPDQRYLTRRYTEQALKFLEDAKDESFFLFLPHSMPHWPQYASEAFAGRSHNGKWGDAVEEIDWSVGQVLDKLKEIGVDDNTVVLFASDNGGARQHGAQNGPLRGGKGSTWEGGHRVCALVRWPGHVPPGTSSDELVSSLDVLPTFAALARAAPPHDRKIDGLDIGPVLLDDNGRSPRDSYYYYFMRHLNAVRDSRYKLFVQRTEGVGGRRVTRPVSELYDLKADIGETSNVADEHPEIVARLKKLAEKARTDLGDGDQAGADTRPPGFAEKAVTLTSN